MDRSSPLLIVVIASILGACSESSTDGADVPNGAAGSADTGGVGSGTGSSPAIGGRRGDGGVATAGAGGIASSDGGAVSNQTGGVANGLGGSATATGGAPGDGGSRSAGGSSSTKGTPRLFYLDVLGGRVLSADPNGADVKVLVTGASGTPDGIAVDVAGRHLFWTNMGAPNANDGFVDRTNLDGTALSAVVPTGGTFTPKQLKIDSTNGKLYWSDREGMRVMRANLDGSSVEVLVETGNGDAARLDASNWCVGIAVDLDRNQIYWTQKGGDNANVGRIRRASLAIPSGETAANRSDVETLFDGLPEPIDLDLDLGSRTIYWTDRGNPPRGNTVSRAPMDPPGSFDPRARTDQEILITGLREGIGIALDLPNGRMYFTDLGGTVYTSSLDGSGQRAVVTGQGILTGIAYAIIPN
jgi:sugar lactone lactonase YvrE